MSEPLDPVLQEAVESLLWAASERANCPICYRTRSSGHTKNCRLGKLHAILNMRVPRVTQTVRCEVSK